MNVRVLEAEAMVVVMQERATETQIELVVARLVEMGMDVHRSTGVTRTVLGVVGQKRPEAGLIEIYEREHQDLRISGPYNVATRALQPESHDLTLLYVRKGGDAGIAYSRLTVAQIA